MVELSNDVAVLDGLEHWREAAIDAALRSNRHGGPIDVVLRAIRRQRGGRATLTQWPGPDRPQLLRFLASLPGGYRSLLRERADVAGQGELQPYLGWYAAEWQGATIEIALPPGVGRGVPAIYVGSDEAALRRFAASVENFALQPVGRCLRYSGGWRSAPDLDAEMGKVTWDDLVLPADVLAGVREAVEGFFRRRDAFAALGFPWRRGLLLIGPPGTGKTMACKAAAAALPSFPFLYVRDFRQNSEQDAAKLIFARARKLAPCILAFEDIDGLVGDWNRTIFLNELDGFQNNEGLLIIASSNHPGKIDQALLKRPSRFDRVFHLGLPGLPERREFCRRMLARLVSQGRLSPAVDIDDLAGRVAAGSDGFTPAYLKEVFLSAALRRAQEGAATLDRDFAAAALAEVGALREHLRALRDPDALAQVGNRGLTPVGFQSRAPDR